MDARQVEQKLWELRVTKAELTREMGINASTLWRFLSGKMSDPRKPFLTALEAALKKLEAKAKSNTGYISKYAHRVNRAP